MLIIALQIFFLVIISSGMDPMESSSGQSTTDFKDVKEKTKDAEESTKDCDCPNVIPIEAGWTLYDVCGFFNWSRSTCNNIMLLMATGYMIGYGLAIIAILLVICLNEADRNEMVGIMMLGHESNERAGELRENRESVHRV